MYKLPENKTFVLDFNIWRCGLNGPNKVGEGKDTRLLNQEGYRCCLGQFLGQCGLEEHALLDKVSPMEALGTFHKELELFADLATGTTRFTNELMYFNDNHADLLIDRVRKLKSRINNEGFKLQLLNFPQEVQALSDE